MDVPHPVIYPLTALPDAYRRVLVLNPMTHLVEAFRTPIYQGDDSVR